MSLCYKLYMSFRCIALQFDMCIHCEVIITTSLAVIPHRMVDPFHPFCPLP